MPSSYLLDDVIETSYVDNIHVLPIDQAQSKRFPFRPTVAFVKWNPSCGANSQSREHALEINYITVAQR